MFDALRVEDVKKFDSVIAHGFHMFDGGIRCRNAVIDFIKAQPVAGNRHEWNVTDLTFTSDLTSLDCLCQNPAQ